MSDYIVKYEESPVRLQQTIKSDWEYVDDIGDNISIREKFPKTENEGKYSLELFKSVENHIELQEAVNKIRPILFEIASVWYFAGGSKILKAKIYTKEELKYSDNFEEVNQEFMEKIGALRVSNSVNLTHSASSTYRCLPLKNALDIYDLLNSDPYCKLLIDFYNQALNDSLSWYVHLYKIKEVLRFAFGNIDDSGKKVQNDKVLRESLNIPKTEIDFFGKNLNNKEDTRHFNIEKPKIKKDEIDELFRISSSWIRKYIEMKLNRDLY